MFHKLVTIDYLQDSTRVLSKINEIDHKPKAEPGEVLGNNSNGAWLATFRVERWKVKAKEWTCEWGLVDFEPKNSATSSEGVGYHLIPLSN